MNSDKTSIFHFNPTCELAISNGSPYYVAPALLREFEEELAPIMRFFKRNKHIIIKEDQPSDKFYKEAHDLGFSDPKFMSRLELENYIKDTGVRKFDLQSWGKSPAESQFSNNLGFKNSIWTPSMKTLFERETSLHFFSDFIQKNPFEIFPCHKQLPQIITSLNEIEQHLYQWGEIVLKAPVSSSGRGLQIIRHNRLNNSNLQWIKTTLKHQKYLTVEKWFNKSFDLSFQYYINNCQQVEYIGPSYFITNSNGQYSGHYLNFWRKEQLPFSTKMIDEVGNLLRKALEQSDYAYTHHGYIGVDAIIYAEGGKTKLHPCIEINARYNMGILSKMIEEYIHPLAKGFFRTYYDPKESFLDFVTFNQKNNPPILADHQLIQGFISLSSPNKTSKFGAYIDLL